MKRPAAWCSLLGLGCLYAGWALGAQPVVIVDPGGAPPEVLQSITESLDAITRLAEDQDVREVARLRRRAWDATQAALRTQGYFDATVDLEATEAQDDQPEYWDITIETGERTQVRQVGLSFSGAIMADPWSARRADLRAGWALQPGMPFINDDWSSAKLNLLDQVAHQDFYYARYGQTQAQIHPDEAQADLLLEVDSGPPVRLGELQVLGLKRVPETLVRRYVRYEPGQAYDQALLTEWQQALQDTQFFRGAFVTLDDGTQPAGGSPDAPSDNGNGLRVRVDVPRPEGDAPVTLPVRVQVTEGLARWFKGSLGVDSDHGARAEALYHQNVVWGWPVWIETGAGVDADRQKAFFDLHLPPGADGARDSLGLLYDHSDVEGVETHLAGLGWKRKQLRKAAGSSRVEYEVLWGGQLLHEENRISGSDRYAVSAGTLNWQWQRRDLNSKYDPREGNLIELGLGVGATLDGAEPFYRARVRAQQWWSVGARDVLTVRAEVGKVWSRSDNVPQSFMWRTGGSRSIRGYRYDSIGVRRGDATAGAPVLGVLGVEYTHYFTDMWGANVFVDAGDAAASFQDFKWHLGYGAGAVANTPAGPFNVALAWAQNDRRLRLVFAMGIAF
ncbi:autotransporter assembly complex family protein [Castellaniella sp.]|uniref:autotransporter assembly complex protein TamA n=1 Tax=Castellaniella sp. TaxID=1955812 RepID=UPI00355F19CB